MTAHEADWMELTLEAVDAVIQCAFQTGDVDTLNVCEGVLMDVEGAAF